MRLGEGHLPQCSEHVWSLLSELDTYALCYLELLFMHLCLSFLFLFEVYLIYIVLASGVQQSDSFILIHILFQILFHYRLLHDIEYVSLCYTVGPCCLSILFYLFIYFN